MNSEKLTYDNNRQQLIQELTEAPDELILVILEFLHRVKVIQAHHPLAKFAGILSEVEAAELNAVIKSECRQVDTNEW